RLVLDRLCADKAVRTPFVSGQPAQDQRPSGTRSLDCAVALFTGADAPGVVNGGDKDLAVANLAGLGGLEDGFNGGLHQRFRQDGFDFDLGQKIHGVFAAAIDFGVPLLAAKTFDFHDGHTEDADAVEGFLNVVQFERFDDGFDFFHVSSPVYSL